MEKPKVIVIRSPAKLLKLKKEKKEIQIKRKIRLSSYSVQLRKWRLLPHLKAIIIKHFDQ